MGGSICTWYVVLSRHLNNVLNDGVNTAPYGLAMPPCPGTLLSMHVTSSPPSETFSMRPCVHRPTQALQPSAVTLMRQDEPGYILLSVSFLCLL